MPEKISNFENLAKAKNSGFRKSDLSWETLAELEVLEADFLVYFVAY